MTGYISSSLLLLAMAAAQPADNDSSRDLVTSDDYPPAALREGRGGSVAYRLVVSTEGAPLSCTIDHSSGSADLDAQTCTLLMARARFSPTVDAKGQPVFSVFRSILNWTPPGKILVSSPKMIDVALTIDDGLSGIKMPVVVKVDIAVGSDGSMSDCRPTPSPASSDKARAAQQHIVDVLGPTACSLILSNLQPRPATDEQGKSVASSQSAWVSFDVARKKR